jgi:hypothetical protein
MKAIPAGILILSIILFLATSIALIIAISLLIPGTILDVLWNLNPSVHVGFTAMGKILGIFLIILGIITLFAGFGILKGKKWAWWIAVFIFAANGLGDIVRISAGGYEDILGGLVGILIAAGVLFYLTRPYVKDFFKKPV